MDTPTPPPEKDHTHTPGRPTESTTPRDAAAAHGTLDHLEATARTFHTTPLGRLAIIGVVASVLLVPTWIYTPAKWALPPLTVAMIPGFLIFGVLLANASTRTKKIVLVCSAALWAAAQALHLYLGLPSLDELIDAATIDEDIRSLATHPELIGLDNVSLWLLSLWIPGTIMGAGSLLLSGRPATPPTTGTASHPPQGAPGDNRTALARLRDAALPLRRAGGEDTRMLTPRTVVALVVGFVGHMLIWIIGMALTDPATIDLQGVFASAIVSLIAVGVGGALAFVVRRTSWTGAVFMIVPSAALTLTTASAMVMEGPVICLTCMLQPAASPLLVAGLVSVTWLCMAPAPPAPDLQALARLAQAEGIDIAHPVTLRGWVSSRTAKEAFILAAIAVLLTPLERMLRFDAHVMWPLHPLYLSLAIIAGGALLWRARPAVLWALCGLSALVEALGSFFITNWYFAENQYGHRYVPYSGDDEVNIVWESAILVVVALLVTTLVVLHARQRDVRVAVAEHQQQLAELAASTPSSAAGAPAAPAAPGCADGTGAAEPGQERAES